MGKNQSDAPEILFDVEATPYDVVKHPLAKPRKDVSGMLLWNAVGQQDSEFRGMDECLRDKAALGWKHETTGHTALHVAVQKKHEDNIKRLLEAGAPVMSLDNDHKVRLRSPTQK